MAHTGQPGLEPLTAPHQAPQNDARHLAIGRVVAARQDTHTLDIELLSGGRLTNVPLLSDSAGRRIGSAELPVVTPGSGRSTATGEHDVYAIVGYLHGSMTAPYVLGLIGPKDAALYRRPNGSAIHRGPGGSVDLLLADGTIESRVPGGRLRFGPAEAFTALPDELLPPSGDSIWHLEAGGHVLELSEDGFTLDGDPVGSGGGGGPVEWEDILNVPLTFPPSAHTHPFTDITGTLTDVQHGDRGGGTLHALATTSVAGFMSAADKVKLDGFSSPVSGGGAENQIAYWLSGSSLSSSGNLTINEPFQGIPARTYVTITGEADAGVLELADGAGDGDGISVGIIQATDIGSGAADKRISGLAFRQDGTTAGNRGGSVSLHTKPDGGSGFTERMRVTQAGRVGIGTTDPATTLDVNGQISAVTQIIVHADSATEGGQLQLKRGTSGAVDYFFDVNSDILRVFTSGGVEILRANSLGDIGIGTSTIPVAGAASGRRFLSIRGASDAGVLELATGLADADSALVGVVQYTDANSVAADKRVAGFGVRLDGATANNRGGALVFFAKPNGSSGFLERMRISQAGNVGIGTASPAAKLDVIDGYIRAREGANNAPTAGTGVELVYTAGAGFVLAYDRAALAYKQLNILGNPIVLNNNPTIGKVGIGTSAPDLELDIESGATTYTGLELTNTHGSTRRWGIGANSNTTTFGPAKGLIIRDISGSRTDITIDTSGGIVIGNNVSVTLGFYGATGISKPAIFGSRGGNAALANLLTRLANLGLITNSTSS